MRVAHYCPVDMSGYGGAETYVIQLVRALRDLGVDVTVISDATGPNSPIEVETNDQAKSKRYDIVHTHGHWRAGLHAMGLEARRVHTYHGMAIGRILACHDILKTLYRTVRYRRSAFTVAFGEWRLGLEADACICVSENTKRDASRFFRLSKNKLTTIPNAFFPHSDGDHVKSEIRARLDIPQEGVLILFVGRDQDPIKGTPTFLEAVRPLLQDGVEAIMVPGLSVNPGDKVRGVGWLYHTDIESYYRAADIYVAPSIYEGGHSLSLLEAMSFGCAPIVSDTPALTEVVQHGVNGLVFSRGSAPQLGDQLKRLIHDPELRQRLGSEAKRSVQSWTWDDTARQTLAIYERVLDGAEQTPKI